MTPLPVVLPAFGGLPKPNPILAPLGLEPKVNPDGEAKAPLTAPVLAPLAPEEGTALAPGFGAVQATQAGDSAALLQ